MIYGVRKSKDGHNCAVIFREGGNALFISGELSDGRPLFYEGPVNADGSINCDTLEAWNVDITEDPEAMAAARVLFAVNEIIILANQTIK